MKDGTKALAVCAVKGGVGKTLISLNVARELANNGLKVGYIDADMDNSNFAQFINTDDKMVVEKTAMFRPYDWEGIQVFSMSLLIGRSKSVSMTGDRYVQILNDAVDHSDWDVDIFVVDLPAGSSDIFRGVMEIFRKILIGNVIVSQPLMSDALERTCYLHDYLDMPVLGVVENMSYFQPHTKRYYPFGKGKTEAITTKFGYTFFGEIPLSDGISEGVEQGKPFFTGDEMETIKSMILLIKDAKIIPVKPSYADKVRKTLKGVVENVLATMLTFIATDVDVNKIREKSGFTEKKLIRLIITDDSGEKSLSHVHLRITEEGLQVVKKPKTVDFDLVGDFKTLARVILGKKKVNGRIVEFDAWDAWLNGDLKAYGKGFAPKAVAAFRTIFSDPDLKADVTKKHGNLLEKWI